MKMKRFFAIFAIIAVLCTFCTVTAMADEADAEAMADQIGVTGEVTEKPAIGNHELDMDTYVETKPATCTTPSEGYAKCNHPDCVEQNLYHYTTYDMPLGHDWEFNWGAVTDIPECMQGGTAVQKCKRCGLEETRELTTIAHEFDIEDGAIVVVDHDDCEMIRFHIECAYGCGTPYTVKTPDGRDEIVYYTYLMEADLKNYPDAEVGYDAMIDAQEFIDWYFGYDQAEGYVLALKHGWTDWSVAKEATCCQDGYELRACTICGAKEEKVIEATEEHDYVMAGQPVLSEDCKTIKIRYECTTCQRDERGQLTGNCAAEGHGWIEETITGDFHKWEPVLENGKPVYQKAPTCTEKGMQLFKCKYCKNKEYREVAALGHSYGEYVLKYTFTKDGVEYGSYVATCSRCGEQIELITDQDPNAATKPSDEPATPPASEPIENTYAISTMDVNKADAGISGTGKLIIVDGDQPIGEMYARTAFRFENEAGEQLLVVNVVSVTEDGSFKVPSVKAPFGYTLKSAHIVAITDEAGGDGAWASYAVCDAVTL